MNPINATNIAYITIPEDFNCFGNATERIKINPITTRANISYPLPTPL